MCWFCEHCMVRPGIDPIEWLVCRWCGKDFKTVFEYVHQHGPLGVCDPASMALGQAKAVKANLKEIIEGVYS